MATLISTGFENGLTPGGLGFSILNHPEQISQNLSVFRHGDASMKITGNAAFSIFAAQGVSSEILTGRAYFQITGTPATAVAIIKADHPTANCQINLNPNGKLQPEIATTSGTIAATILSANTWYLLDFRFDASTTTFKIDWKLSDTNGTLIESGTQQTLTGQTAAAFTQFQIGQNGNVSLSTYWDDPTVTDQAGDYPLGAGVGDDGTFPPITNYPPSWLDTPSLVSDGMVFGMMTLNTGSGDNGQTAASEGATKANRQNFIIQSFYTNVQGVGTLNFEQTVQTGTLLGHEAWPMVNPFGFGSTTTNWPAGGLADFTNGNLDSIIDQWIAVFNSKLGLNPFFIRLFREMTNQVTIYGPNGSSVGGLNETPDTFIPAWRHIYTRIRQNVPMARFVWCPDSVQDPSVALGLYPGDSYVDWIGVDAYKTSGNGYSLDNLRAWYAAFKPGGSYGLTKPIMVCETSVQAADPNRITDFASYNTEFDAMPLFKAVIVWDSSATGPYYVSDSPPGFLSTFQSVVSSPPFTATILTTPPASPTVDLQALWDQKWRDIAVPFPVDGLDGATINLEKLWDQRWRDISVPFPVDGAPGVTINIERMWDQKYRDESVPFPLDVP